MGDMSHTVGPWSGILQFMVGALTPLASRASDKAIFKRRNSKRSLIPDCN